MNEFVLKEKHKYWDNKITLEEYIKNTEDAGYIDCSSNYEYEFWYILENLKKLNNLQSKIDKANDLLDKLEIQPAYLDCKYYELDGFNQLRDILEEDKFQEIPQFKGTMEQLDELCDIRKQ